MFPQLQNVKASGVLVADSNLLHLLRHHELHRALRLRVRAAMVTGGQSICGGGGSEDGAFT